MRRSRTLRAASLFLALRTASLSSSLVLGLSSSLSDVESSTTVFFLTPDFGIAADKEIVYYSTVLMRSSCCCIAFDSSVLLRAAVPARSGQRTKAKGPEGELLHGKHDLQAVNMDA
jgi:hypothetical protein